MKMANLFEEMTDYYFENEYLCELYDIRDYEIYKEIVLFLDDFKPEWRKNKELGYYAPEFILQIIEEYEDSYDFDNPYQYGEQYELFQEADKPNLAFKNWLKEMYEYIDDLYNRFSTGFNVEIEEVDQILEDQGITIENDEDYMLKWNEEYENLKVIKGEEVYLFF